jgi:hypothetical protein
VSENAQRSFPLILSRAISHDRTHPNHYIALCKLPKHISSETYPLHGDRSFLSPPVIEDGVLLSAEVGPGVFFLYRYDSSQHTPSLLDTSMNRTDLLYIRRSILSEPHHTGRSAPLTGGMGRPGRSSI